MGSEVAVLVNTIGRTDAVTFCSMDKQGIEVSRCWACDCFRLGCNELWTYCQGSYHQYRQSRCSLRKVFADGKFLVQDLSVEDQRKVLDIVRKEEMHRAKIDREKADSALNAAVARAVEELEHVGKAVTEVETLHDRGKGLRNEIGRRIKQVLEEHRLL